MNIAVASGKGGTGKTTVATNLAWVASGQERTVRYLDCDVEEPNGALFLKPHIHDTQPVMVSVPEVNQQACTHCGLCGQICQYSAIVPMPTKVMVFADLCHGCAGCWEVCPSNAIRESHRQTGILEIGTAGGVAATPDSVTAGESVSCNPSRERTRDGKHSSECAITARPSDAFPCAGAGDLDGHRPSVPGGVECVQGMLNIGEVMSPPVIEAVREHANNADIVITDSPPGTSCPVIAAIRGADVVLLVTEPTPFGLNDLKLAVDMVRALALPMAVVINRADTGDNETARYCHEQQIDILAEIPDDRQVAEAYSRGEMAVDALPQYRLVYQQLLEKIIRMTHTASV